MVTTKHPGTAFQAVANDAHAALRASWGQCLNRAFEAVKRIAIAVSHDLKRFVVVISAGVALGHGSFLNQWNVAARRFNTNPLARQLRDAASH